MANDFAIGEGIKDAAEGKKNDYKERKERESTLRWRMVPFGKKNLRC